MGDGPPIPAEVRHRDRRWPSCAAQRQLLACTSVPLFVPFLPPDGPSHLLLSLPLPSLLLLFCLSCRCSPLNSVWEGSGNVIALDIQRTCAREPAALLAFAHRVGSTAGDHPALAAHLTALLRLGMPAGGGSTGSGSSSGWEAMLKGMQGAQQLAKGQGGAGKAGGASAGAAAALSDPLHARFVAEQLAVALMGHALALTKRAAAAAGGEAATRAADVLDLFCQKHMPSGGLMMHSVMLGAAAPPSAGGDAAGRDRLKRIVEADVAAIRAALA